MNLTEHAASSHTQTRTLTDKNEITNSYSDVDAWVNFQEFTGLPLHLKNKIVDLWEYRAYGGGHKVCCTHFLDWEGGEKIP